MTAYEIGAILKRLGVRETKSETYPNTFSLVNSSSFLAQQVDNRDSASWKKAEYIILTDSAISAGVLNGWKRLTDRDPLPQAIQKLCVPRDDGKFDVYDAHGKIISSENLDKIIKHTPDIIDVLVPQSSHVGKDDLFSADSTRKPSQVIFYGVPGCGKSNRIDEKLKGVSETNKIRVVFHPEYTNADFVGQILPKVNGHVTYEFNPGPFTKILAKAYQKPSEHFYLVIEEINRGNAAAIFGDIFQLLDRIKPGDKDNSLGNGNIYPGGWSQYFVQNDDINAFIRTDESKALQSSISIGSINFTENTGIRLPPNLSIIATMNTSDQNVFTLDNAFQRRFDMVLIRNEFEAGNFGGFKTEAIQKQHNAKIEGTEVTWAKFWTRINEKMAVLLKGLASTEDKRLGVWFVSNVDGIIPKKVFAEKVLKYLWDDAFKFKRTDIFETDCKTIECLIKKFEEADGMDCFKVFKNLDLNESAS